MSENRRLDKQHNLRVVPEDFYNLRNLSTVLFFLTWRTCVSYIMYAYGNRPYEISALYIRAAYSRCAGEKFYFVLPI